MIRRLVFSLFAFAVFCAFGDGPIYYLAFGPSGPFVGYSWDSDFPSVVGSLFPSFSPLDPNDPSAPWASPDHSSDIQPLSPDGYSSALEYFPYIPFSSDPVYSSSTPSSPPSGGGSSSDGGNGEGGFDPVGSLSALSSFASGLSSAVLGVLGVACFVFLSFIAWRKFLYSSKRV